MTIAHDAASGPGASGTGNLSWTHTPVSSHPRCALVLVAQGDNTSTDNVSGVTYGGVAMSEVALSPLIHSTGSEDGVLYGYFLDGILPGAQSVVVSATTTEKHARCFTMTADGACEVHDTSTLDSGSVTNPSVTLTIGGGIPCQCYGVCHSGQQAITSIAAGSGTSEVFEFDFTADCASWTRSTDVQTADFVYGWTIGVEEGGILAVAIREAVGALRLRRPNPMAPLLSH